MAGVTLAGLHDVVGALAEALAAKETGDHGHIARVTCYAVALARAVEPSLLEDASVEYGFMLHDAGKIGIPDTIVQKIGPFTPEERRVMEEHPLLGWDVLRGVEFLQGGGLAVVRSHHERWDGMGYPDRLAGDDIPLAARVFAVADSLDAMTSDRLYRPAKSWAEATLEIGIQSGSHFDPRAVDAFKEIAPRLQAECQTGGG